MMNQTEANKTKTSRIGKSRQHIAKTSDLDTTDRMEVKPN